MKYISHFIYLTTINVSKQSSICPKCTGWMLEKDGYLRCSCGYCIKIVKRIIKPLRSQK